MENDLVLAKCQSRKSDSFPLSAWGFGICNVLVYNSSSHTMLHEYFTWDRLLAGGLTNWIPIEHKLFSRLGGPREISPKIITEISYYYGSWLTAGRRHNISIQESSNDWRDPDLYLRSKENAFPVYWVHYIEVWIPSQTTGFIPAH